MKKYLTLILILFLTQVGMAKDGAPTRYNTYDGTGPGARPLGLGYAFCAVGGEPDTIYYNPAGLIAVQKQFVSLSYEIGRQSDLSNDDIFSGESLRAKNLNFIGLSSGKGAFSFRPIANYAIRNGDKNGSQWDETEVKVNAITASAANSTDSNIDLGVNISYLTGRIAQAGIKNNVPYATLAEGDGFNLDFGAMFKVSQELKLGVNLQNLLGFIWWDDFKTEQLPFSLRAGFAFQISGFLTFASDIEKRYYRKERDEQDLVHFGIEQVVGNTLILRVGMYGDNLNKQNSTRYTAGVGYQKSSYLLSLSGEKYKVLEKEVFRYLFSLDIPLSFKSES